MGWGHVYWESSLFELSIKFREEMLLEQLVICLYVQECIKWQQIKYNIDIIQLEIQMTWVFFLYNRPSFQYTLHHGTNLNISSGKNVFGSAFVQTCTSSLTSFSNLSFLSPVRILITLTILFPWEIICVRFFSNHSLKAF